jgi:hypothetical protein
MAATGVVQTAVVGLPAVLTVPESQVVVIRRGAMVDAGSAENMFEMQGWNGSGYELRGYFNEDGLWRSRAPGNEVAARAQCDSTDNDTTQNIFEATTSGNDIRFAANAIGDITAHRDVSVGRNVIFTSPAADVTLEPVGLWTEPSSYGTGIAGSVGSPYFDVGARLETWGRVFLRGRVITTAGVSYVGDATIFTLPAGLRPAATVLFTIRSQGTGSANGTVSINTSGQFSYSAAITLTGGQTASWQLDGLSFPVAV